MSAFDTGKSLVQQILAKLPEGTRAIVAPAFEAAEASEALTLLGDLGMARSDYSRQSDTLRTQAADLEAKRAELEAVHARQEAWWQENAPKVQGYDTLKPEYDRLKAGGMPPAEKKETPPAAGLTIDDLNKILLEREAGYAGVMALSSQLAARHFGTFGEFLDTAPLMRLANERKLTLEQAYDATFGDRIKAKAGEVEKARIDKIVEERLAEERKKNPMLPGPSRAGVVEPSALDTLLTNPAERSQRYTADSAADRYEQLVNAGGRGA